MVYRMRWWLVGIVARVYTRFLFKSFETIGTVKHDGPTLIVANHLSGLLDAVVVMRLLGGIPHILAKSTLFDPAPVGWAFKALGIIPVYRRSDEVDMEKNASMFSEVTKVLVKGRTVLIFPEGKVTDNQELQTIRTGAARMALDALGAGAAGLTIVPVGITYENKIASRPRVLVEVGTEIVDAEIRGLAGEGTLDDSNHALVDEVTDVVTQRLGAVSPEYGSFIRERMMMFAASIHLRTSMTTAFQQPKMSQLRNVAQRLARETAHEDTGRYEATGSYQLALSACGLADDQIQPRPRSRDLGRVVLRKGIVLLLIAPIALFGLIANLVAILLVVGAGALVTKPMTKGTARAITGVIAFPASWAVLIAVTNPAQPLLSLVFIVVGLIVLIIGFNLLIDLGAAALDWWGIHNSRSLLPELASLRSEAESELDLILSVEDEPT